MIIFYGDIGQGKTLAMVDRTYKKWLRNPNLKVFTNTPLNFPLHPKTKKPISAYNFDDLLELRDFFLWANANPREIRKRPTLILIDEASVMLSSRSFASLPMFFRAFMAQSRHLNCDFWATTQGIWRVDKIAREMADFWVYCSKVPYLGWIFKEKRTIDPDTCRIIKRGLPSFIFRPKKVYPLYNTYHMVGYSALQEKVEEQARNMVANEKLNKFLDENYMFDNSNFKVYNLTQS